MSRVLRVRKHHRRAAVTVEFAITAPILFLFIFGLIECSRMSMLANSLENAVYEGCRAAIVPGATQDQALTATTTILNAVGAVSPTVTVSPNVIDDTVAEVTVSATLPASANLWAPSWLSSSMDITRSCTLRRERTTVVTP